MKSSQPTELSTNRTASGHISHPQHGAARSFGLPVPLLARILVLFFGLSLIKGLMLSGMGRHLYESHWRVLPIRTTWVDYLALGVFLCIGVLGILRLGRDCIPAGIRAVRAANAIVLSLGFFFILLTFHTGDRNYLYPIMTAVLDWDNLLPYLSMDFFFRPPWLGAWFLGYTLAYYFLFRTGREHWTLYLTAGFAGLYGATCLQGLLDYGHEMLVASCFGIAALVITDERCRKIGILAILLPAAGCIFFAWGIWKLAQPFSDEVLAYFNIILGATTVLFAGSLIWARRHGFFPAWAAFMWFYAAGFLLLTNTNYPVADNFRQMLCLGFELPRYLAGELLVAATVTALAAALFPLRPRLALWCLDAVVLLLFTLAAADLALSRITGVRLGWDLLVFANSPVMMIRMARPYLPGFLLGLLLIAILYWLIMSTLSGRWSRAFEQGHPENSAGFVYLAVSSLLLACIGLCVAGQDKARGQTIINLTQSSPLWRRTASRTLTPQEFIEAAANLGLPPKTNFQTGTSAPGFASAQHCNVVLVLMESSFNKHLSLFGGQEETQPELSRYKDRMEVFPRFFSNFAGSIHARFATFTGLYPTKDFNLFTLQRVGVKSIFEVLHEHGYNCSMFYSSSFDYTHFGDFLARRGISELYDAESMPGERKSEPVAWGLHEEETLEAIRDRLKRYASSEERFFLTYIPAAPHYPYDKLPKRFQKYEAKVVRDYTPCYLNALLYMDWVIGSILDELKQCDLLDRTVVVITNDHGEMLGGVDGAIGHGWAVTPDLGNTPLIIMNPANSGHRINEAVGSQVDLLPTILQVLQIPLPERELYQGQSLYSSAERRSLIYLNSYQQYGIIDGNRLFVGDRKQPTRTDVYSISNHNSKTVFSSEGTDQKMPASIEAFDTFQENFLRNYSFYTDHFGTSEGAFVTRR